MTQTADRKNWYLSSFARFEQSLNGQLTAPVHQIRRSAIERFGSLGFPTTRDEEWRYTSVAPIARVDFAPVVEPDLGKLTADALAPFLFAGLEGAQLVFVDGHYAAVLSRADQLPAGATVTSLAQALEEQPAEVGAHLSRYADGEQEPFTALNTAFVRDGAFIRIPRNAVVEHPIHLLFVSTRRSEPTISHPRVLCVAESGSQVTLIESYAGLEEAQYFTNAVTEIVADQGAVVDHYKIQRESAEAFHISDLHVRQGRDVQFRSTCFTLGGRLTRNHAHTALDGEGIDSTLNGLYLVDDQQHVDNHTLIEHIQPNCSSHEYYKGILDGRSTGVFRGQILVHQAAQKTDAYQANRNLLLCDDADINTKPQLEIYADDVKCSHGSTVGQLDPDAIFYLRSRGIGQADAVQILTRAFAGELVGRVRVDAVRQQLDRLVSNRLTRTGH